MITPFLSQSYKKIMTPRLTRYVLRMWKLLWVGTLLLLLFIIFIYCIVNLTTKRYREEDLNKLTPAHTALVLGSMVQKDGTLALPLKDRVDTAIELYKAGIVETILVSGDNSSVEYNEVNPSRDYILAHGVPSDAIFLDHAGFDTYSSMYRARDVFLVDSVIVVTQSFHLPRAVFIARNLGLDAYGMSADKRKYLFKNNIREVLANVKAVFNVLYERKPKYLGDEIPITGDPEESI